MAQVDHVVGKAVPRIGGGKIGDRCHTMGGVGAVDRLAVDSAGRALPLGADALVERVREDVEPRPGTVPGAVRHDRTEVVGDRVPVVERRNALPIQDQDVDDGIVRSRVRIGGIRGFQPLVDVAGSVTVGILQIVPIADLQADCILTRGNRARGDRNFVARRFQDSTRGHRLSERDPFQEPGRSSGFAGSEDTQRKRPELRYVPVQVRFDEVCPPDGALAVVGWALDVSVWQVEYRI